MIFRRKRRRIPYDAPGSRSRKKAARAANRRVDELFITRRVFLFKGVAVAGFSGLAVRLGLMQLRDGETWSAQAVSNVQRWRELKPARGMILDRQGRVLAENVKTWSVNVIPNDLPELDTPEWAYIRGQLVTALRLPDVVMVDPRSIPVGAREQVYRRLGQLLGDATDTDYRQTVLNITQQLKYNPYAIFKDVGDEPAAMINEFRSELPGITVVSLLDYLVDNYYGYETPILVKGNVSRDVAMKLAANAIYLPGVELDDQALTRSYPGGLAMSHVLGFAGPVTEEELKLPANYVGDDENGQPSYRYYKPGDIIGKQGLEGYYEDQLRGLKGGYLYETDGTGREVRQVEGHYQPAVPGRNLRLTIDTELQAAIAAILEQELPIAMERRKVADERDRGLGLDVPDIDHQSKGAAVVISDVATGEVVAMVSHPSYDNQLFVDGISNRKYQELAKNPQDPLVDKSFMGRYPPGSTIKPFMALTGLREGVIAPDSTFSCRGGIKVLLTFDQSKGQEYKCWASGGHGDLNLENAINQSCDVYFYNVGVPRGTKTEDADVNQYFDFTPTTGAVGEEHTFQGLGIAKIHSALTKRFWFNKATGIDLPVENNGFVGDDQWKRDNYQGQGWSIGDTVNASIGQGFVEASPLQMAVNTAALANGGTVWKPRVVQAIVDDEGAEIQRFASVQKRKVRIDANHIGLVLGAMKGVVHNDDGTAAYFINLDGTRGDSKWLNTNPPGEKEIFVGGKTGTAEFGKVDPTRKDENGDPFFYYDYHAWFTCFSPFDEPEVAIASFVESGGQGSTNAVPIADKALRAYYETTGRRPRGLMLRRDKQPAGEGVPLPWQDGYRRADDKAPNTGGGATPESDDDAEPTPVDDTRVSAADEE